MRRAFGQMLEVADRLGDGLVNARPLGTTTNAVSGLVIHCCEVAELEELYQHLGHIEIAADVLIP